MKFCCNYSLVHFKHHCFIGTVEENETGPVEDSKVSCKTTWDAYIDNMIHQAEDEDGRCHISRACIIALEDGVRWTSDSHPKVSFTVSYQTRVVTLMKLFSSWSL